MHVLSFIKLVYFKSLGNPLVFFFTSRSIIKIVFFLQIFNMCLRISIIISVVLIIVFSLILIFTVKLSRTVSSIANNNCTTMRDFTYPVARRDGSVVDDFHGTKVTLTTFFLRKKCVEHS